MKHLLRILVIFLSVNTSIFSEEPIPEKPLKFGLQLIKSDGNEYLALNFENHPHWHTYWKNPGDAGLPIKNIFSVDNKEIKFEELEWPAPKRYIEPGDLWAYGYEGTYSIFYKISKQDFNRYSGKKIELKSTWLICKNICIPGQELSEFKLNPGNLVNLKKDQSSPLNSNEIISRFQSLPKTGLIPDYLNMKLSKGKANNTLVMTYEVKNTIDTSYLNKNNLLYFFPKLPFDVKHETLIVESASLRGITEISWDGEYQSPPEDLPANGIFKKPYVLTFLFSDPITKKSIVIEKKFDRFEVTPVATPVTTKSENASNNTNSSVINAQETNTLVYYLALAFVGGLILNIMPCVLPVISIKLFGLVKYRNESHRKIIKHNVFYTLGILFTFAILATIVLSLKSIGSQVGWGFQLQSPNFIAVMIIGLFIFALNLFGLFEFSTPGGSKLGNVTIKDSFFGDFLSGILATVLSTPCSAPFLGTALTFAFTSSSLEIYLIFSMIGLGLASPFILTAFYPKLVAFIPKPGNWMNTVKKLLGLSLVLTALWLFDVYNALVDGQAHLLKLGTVLVFIYLGFFILRKKEKLFGAISFLVALGLFLNLSTSKIVASTDTQTALIKDKQSKGLDWQPWSELRMNDHKTNGETVFIDFTAKWCFTCKVNERLVLDTEAFKTLVKESNLKLLIGDWTKRDEIIGSFLRKNGLVGVPAYFIQKKDGTLVNLGETVTIARIKKYLE
ncbi:MAG: hypothetical protein HOP07_12840 [Bacteriovoracaceae bacterium]|nr:hypothetical protein [Bacteriovoracaceae bacterium]